MEINGNLVLYFREFLLWTSSTRLRGNRFRMQSNGIAALCDDLDYILFSTKTSSIDQDQGHHFKVLNNGDMVVYDIKETPIWSMESIFSLFPIYFFFILYFF